MVKKIVLIGSGNVAYHLIRSIQKATDEFEFVGCYARKERPSLQIQSICGDSYTNNLLRIPKADIYIVSVFDDAIGEVIDTLQDQIPQQALVLHTSGTKSMETINPRFQHRGVLYPLQTFSTNVEVEMKAVPFFIECNDPADRAIIERIATQIGHSATYTDSQKRKIIHIAAVFSCNFTNHLYAISQEILKKEGLDFKLLEPLIKECARKALTADDIYSIQTGPAIREDFNTINEHKKMLSEKIEKIYEDLTNSIIKNGKF